MADENKARNPLPGSETTELRFTDGSTMKVSLKDERIELGTPYGKLLIPVGDIHRIEFGRRISEEIQKRIATAVLDLGHKEFRRRQAASVELLALKDKAYWAILEVSKDKDQEKARRAKELLEKIRDEVAAEDLEVPSFDVVVTKDSKIAGHIAALELRVKTLPFGAQQVRLSDMRSLQAVSSKKNDAVTDAQPDPGTLVAYQNQQPGTRLAFKVTGALPGQIGGVLFGGVFGTNTYTMDSVLASAAVHAGAVQPGKTAVIHVTILGPQPGFQGSMQNGIMSNPYGPWAGYRIETTKPGKRRE